MYSVVKQQALEFKKKYPGTIAWRIGAHSKVVENHLNPGEDVKFVFVGQKYQGAFELFNTCVIVLTSKRILIGVKRMLFGYFLYSITPDMFNDLKVRSNIIWGTVEIDTVKENVFISKISKKALDPIETELSEYMIKEKKKYHMKKAAE